MSLYKKIAYISVILLLGILILLTVSSQNFNHKGFLFVSFLNVGQGDAIFIQAPNGTQVLVDGGGDKVVLNELGRVMPMFDRTIDAIVITNPDKDHIGGFIDVIQRYEIQTIIEPGTISTTDTYKTVKKLANENGLNTVYARRGMNIVLDETKGVYLQILFPDRDVSNLSTNDGSVIAKLVYGETSIMLQGDAPDSIEKYLLYLNKGELNSDILKVGHHGSKTSTNKEYIEALSPDYAVISLGGDNKYGHPHKETLDTLNGLNVPILRTDLEGRISFVSDGSRFVRTE